MRGSRGQDAAAGLGRGTRANSTLCMGTSHARQRTALGPYRKTMPRALWGSSGGGLFLMSEVPLYLLQCASWCDEALIRRPQTRANRGSRRPPPPRSRLRPNRYRSYWKVRTHTAIGPYGRSIPRNVGPSSGRCVSLNSSNPTNGLELPG